MDIGNKIQKIRTDQGMTQAEFADKFHVTRQTISNWGNNKSYPDLETLVLISGTFDVSLDAMLKGDRKMVSEISKAQKHGNNFAIKIIIAVIAATAIVLGGIYYIESHESYIPYDEAGITVEESGIAYTDKSYHRLNSFQYVTETVDGVNHCTVFTYLNSSVYSRCFERRPEHKSIIDNYAEINGQSIDDKGELLNDLITEVYYLPDKYVTEHGLMNSKHPELITIGTSDQESKAMINQMKADSVLLWKRK